VITDIQDELGGEVASRISGGSFLHQDVALEQVIAAVVVEQLDRKEALSAPQDAYPIGYLGDPEDIAYGVLYLALDGSKWTTGMELVLDGGWTAA
jgi:NAD(P)-dependent dehydrogenase (short-subunit alcohol dehydrogenase family)